MAGHEVHLAWTELECDREPGDHLKRVSQSDLLLDKLLEF